VTLNNVPARLFAQRGAMSHKTGNDCGAGVLCQFVLTRPAVDSWKPIVPAPAPEVHSSRKDVPCCSFTVTRSSVGVVA
jgi:hypothetical protein